MKKRAKISVFILTFMLAVSMMPAFANAQKLANNNYLMVNKNSGLLLSLEKYIAVWDGEKLIQYGADYPDRNSWQKWTVTYMGKDGGGEYYRLVNIGSKRALDVPGSTRQAGVQMQVWTVNNSNAQMWYARDNGDGSFSWISKGSGFFLDINGASKEPWAKVIQWYGNGGNNQRWIMRR